MRRWQYDDIRKKIESDLDLQDETFITPDELMGYCNEGIDQAQAEIHKLGQEDLYFLAQDAITLVSGQIAYAMPSDIYANKIRKLVYQNGTLIYAIRRMKGQDAFEQIPLIQTFNTNQFYRHLIVNNASTGPMINLYPTPQESGPLITRWYIRDAARISLVTDYLDVPECAINFVIQFMKCRCYEKEAHPNLGGAASALDQHRKLMIETLTEEEPDGDDAIEMDLSFYRDMS